MNDAAFIDASEAPPRHTNQIKIYGADAFAGMRKAGRLAAECLDMLAPHVKPGVTTGHLDDLAREFVLERGGLPACLFYKGYRNTVCTSINHVVCHGIPNDKPLRDGDIVRLDAEAGVLDVLISMDELRARPTPVVDLSANDFGMGRELFAGMRRLAGSAEDGAAVASGRGRHRTPPATPVSSTGQDTGQL